jgi:antitoxin MazE
MHEISLDDEDVMSQATIGKWGKSLAVRLPSDVASVAGICEGVRVEITTQEDAILIRRVAPRYRLAELFAGKSPQEWRALYADAWDWGPDVGREIVEE